MSIVHTSYEGYRPCKKPVELNPVQLSKKCSWNIIFRLVDAASFSHPKAKKKTRNPYKNGQLLENKPQFCPDFESVINFDKKK